jgi:hypothetical protein
MLAAKKIEVSELPLKAAAVLSQLYPTLPPT